VSIRRLRGRVIRGIAVLAAGAAVLTACSGLPVSGPINPGVPADEVPDAPFLYYPGGPTEGATPEQIVSGFVEAATSPAADWATAREFLTASFSADWAPDTHVTIDVPSSRVYDAARLESDGIVEVEVESVATVDETGVYRTSEESSAELAFELEQQDDGEWRISKAPAGIVIDRDYFATVYRDYTLRFVDPTWNYLVPDVRWFPTETTATKIASALLAGESPYVEGGVDTAFPGGTTLAAGGVVVDDSGVADITLSQEAADASDTQVGLMRAQLVASLAGLGVESVRLHIGGEEVTSTEYTTLATKPDSRPLVLGDTGYDTGFGFLDSGGQIDDLTAFGDAEELADDAEAISLSADRTSIVVQDSNGDVWRRTADGGSESLDQRKNLIEPTLDPQGYPWSVPSDSPAGLTAYTPDYQPIEIDHAFAGARRVSAMSVSPDGSRMAALVSTASGNWAVVVPILRDGDGAPTSLGDPVGVTALSGEGIDVTWLDSGTLGVVAEDSAGIEIVQQPIGGPATRMSSVEGITQIEAGSQQTIARLLDKNGTLYVRRGSTWQPAATGVSVLATQLGAPS